MIPIISLQDVKDQRHVVGTYQDSDLQMIALAASAWIWNYLKVDFTASPVVFPWTGDIPFDVIAATKLVAGDLDAFREGSQVVANFKNFDVWSPAVKSLLAFYRRGTVA